ncbi:MAG: DNA translocase FtsK 4TM domain-containing protein, partial [Deltaproteobacteria bacterium]|nr:DNA translocase FtsK 4TM domain-containing protein [Deltaproteobacteria bacterium]
MIEDSIKEKLKREIIGILLVAIAIFLFLSLISYKSADPSLFSYSSQKVKVISNWMGIVGAYVSGLLFQGFGFPSFLIPFVLGFYAFGFIFRLEWKYPLVKLGGWAVILLTTSSLFSLWMKPLRIYAQDFLEGGFIGEILSRN